MPNGHVVLHVVAMVMITLLLKKLTDFPTLNNTDPTQQQTEYEPTADDRDVHTVQSESYKPGNKIADDIDEPTSPLPSVTQQEPITSSVWCYDSGMCRFSNLCYNSAAEEFVMFRNNNSVFENVLVVDGSLTIDLSSVTAHNVYQTTVVTLPSDSIRKFPVKWVHRRSLVFKRFLAGNIMHVFHDDLFPLHHSLKLITFGDETQVWDRYDIQLFLFENDIADIAATADDTNEHGNIENQELDDIDKLYALFSKWDIKYKLDFRYNDGLTCFKDVYIGLSRTTNWYDFGFTKQQGPIDNHMVSSRGIRSTVQFILHQIGTDQPKWTMGDYLVLFTRKENRLILNEMELTLAIVGRVKMKVLNLDYESQSLTDIIRLVGNSRGILGMHGSLLTLSAFLKKGSILVELFPYAVNPDRYTPYKTLANLKEMGIVYKAWSNQNAVKSFGHPDWPAKLGGLMHIEEDQREIIMQQTDVPPHLCCSDPSWLYHIYQDTEVDTKQIVSLVDSSLKESNKLLNKLDSDIYPSKVLGVTCNTKIFDADDRSETLTLVWDVPWTVAVTINKQTNVMYDVLIQDVSDKSKSVIEKRVELPTLVVTVDIGGRYVVWVRCLLDSRNTGPYSDACSCLDNTDYEFE